MRHQNGKAVKSGCQVNSFTRQPRGLSWGGARKNVNPSATVSGTGVRNSGRSARPLPQPRAAGPAWGCSGGAAENGETWETNKMMVLLLCCHMHMHMHRRNHNFFFNTNTTDPPLSAGWAGWARAYTPLSRFPLKLPLRRRSVFFLSRAVPFQSGSGLVIAFT